MNPNSSEKKTTLSLLDFNLRLFDLCHKADALSSLCHVVYTIDRTTKARRSNRSSHCETRVKKTSSI